MAGTGQDRIHVLHVDDDPDFADLAATFLERNQDRLRIETATSAEKGLQIVNDRPPDCVVSDYNMPEVDGLELLQAVREDYPEIPFILFTGKGSEAVASQAISAGVTDYIQKQSGSHQFELLANRIERAVEQYRTEQALDRQNRRLTALFENFPEPTITYTYEDGIPYVARVNDAFTETFGYEPEEAVGTPVDTLVVPPDRREEARDIDDRVKAGEMVDEVLRRQTTEGLGDFSFRNISLPDDEEIDGFAVYADITELKDHQRELETTKQRLDAILEHSTTPMFMKDAAGQYIFVNRAYKQVFGIEEVRGRTAHDIYPAEVADRIEEMDRNILESGDPVEFESQETFDGETRWFLTTVVPLYGTDEETETDEADALFGVASDITALKERERDLERERDRLDDFASIVSHDLHNPLNVASARLELASEECESDHLAAVAGALDRMDELIDGLLTLAREGEPVSDIEPVAVSDVCQACWETTATGNASLVVETDLTVQADRNRLQQLLENLVRNAVEHGGTDVTITIGETDDGIYVADDGPGIPESEREEIFEAGYSPRADSTGLGLSITKEIVRAHGWEISVSESDDGGVRFEITGVEIME